MTTSLRLPPSERDFEIYQQITMRGLSTRLVAEDHEISQTRVRQIVRRVLDWIAATLPDKPEADEKRELRLAQHIAADRIQEAYCELMSQWRQKREPRFMGQLMRLTFAAARLGVLPGTIDALAADALEGPLPTPTRSVSEGPPPELVTRVPPGNTEPRGSALAESDAHCSTPPPPGDCSPSAAIDLPSPQDVEPALATNSTAPTTCAPVDASSEQRHDSAPATSRPLLTSPSRLPVTGLHIAPDQPGAVTLDAICRNLQQKKRDLPRRVRG